jgi:hypothetical protein
LTPLASTSCSHKTATLTDRRQVLGDQFRGEARDRIGIGEDRQRIVLRLVSGAAASRRSLVPGGPTRSEMLRKIP